MNEHPFVYPSIAICQHIENPALMLSLAFRYQWLKTPFINELPLLDIAHCDWTLIVICFTSPLWACPLPTLQPCLLHASSASVLFCVTCLVLLWALLSNDIAYYGKHDKAMPLVHKKLLWHGLVYESNIREFKKRCSYFDTRAFNCG
jgi:hypothetical protein